MITGLLFTLLLVYLLLMALLYVFQRSLLYFPTAPAEHSFQRMLLSSQQESLDIVVLNPGQPGALIYFGGNAETVVASAAGFQQAFAGFSVYLMNYRGYGGSSGSPSEAGILADALALYDKLQPQHTQISAIGRSLGSGVAVYLAANRPVNKLALITPYDSILSLARARYPVFPVRLLLKDQYDSLSRAPAVQAEVLVIAAEYDQVIPMGHTQTLTEAFAQSPEMVVIRQAGHNDLTNEAEYIQSLSNFFVADQQR